MKPLIALVITLTISSTLGAALNYEAISDWIKLPEGRENIGNMHGDVAVSSAGEIYVSVQDPKAGVQVYSADGKWIRNVKGAAKRLSRLRHPKTRRRRIPIRSAPRRR